MTSGTDWGGAPPDAPEWAQVRGSVYRAYQNAANAARVSGPLRARVLELRQRVDSALGSDPGGAWQADDDPRE